MVRAWSGMLSLRSKHHTRDINRQHETGALSPEHGFGNPLKLVNLKLFFFFCDIPVIYFARLNRPLDCVVVS